MRRRHFRRRKHGPPSRPRSKLVFERRAFAPERASKTPSVSNVRFADIDRDGKLEIVATEMSYGYVMVGRPADPQARLLEIVADIPHPSHTALVRPGQGRTRRPAGRQPRVVPARRPPARRRRVAPADGGWALRRVRVDGLPTGRRRRGRRLQRRRQARPAGRRIRLAQHRVHRPADQPHRRLLAAVVRDDATGRAHRAPSTSSRPT